MLEFFVVVWRGRMRKDRGTQANFVFLRFWTVVGISVEVGWVKGASLRCVPLKIWATKGMLRGRFLEGRLACPSVYGVN